MNSKILDNRQNNQDLTINVSIIEQYDDVSSFYREFNGKTKTITLDVFKNGQNIYTKKNKIYIFKDLNKNILSEYQKYLFQNNENNDLYSMIFTILKSLSKNCFKNKALNIRIIIDHNKVYTFFEVKGNIKMLIFEKNSQNNEYEKKQEIVNLIKENIIKDVFIDDRYISLEVSNVVANNNATVFQIDKDINKIVNKIPNMTLKRFLESQHYYINRFFYINSYDFIDNENLKIDLDEVDKNGLSKICDCIK